MRKEAKKVYDQLIAGKKVSEIKAGPHTKASVHKKYLYRKLVNVLFDDLVTGDYYFDVYQIQNMLKEHERSKSQGSLKDM